MKYVMIPINCKYDNNDQMHVRRVLVQYEKTQEEDYQIFYTNTRFLAKDPYFEDKTRSHQYEFLDEGYRLIDVTNEHKEIEASVVNITRRYHYNLIYDLPKGIEFEADSDEVAIKKFHEREELRD